MVVRFQPVTSIFDEIDSFFSSPVLPFVPMTTQKSIGRFGSVSVKEGNDAVTVTFELPGVAKSDVSVKVNDGTLTVSAERKQPELKEQEQWIRNEIFYGTYERSVALPYAVDVENIVATQDNGLLRIVLPKHETAKPKHISIR